MGSRLPDFLLLGAPKCGTSALHNALSGHPQLFLSTPKEPKFFLTDGPPPDSGGGPGDLATWGEHVWRRDEYEALFTAADPDALCGESTVFYLYDRDAQRRIRDLLPGARLIAVLRDPIERAHSNWAHLRGAGLEPEADFVRALEREEERIAAGWAHFWHYTAQGRYGGQLEHLFSLFPSEQVLLLRYRELRDDPAGTADRVCRFLGVETGIVAGVSRHQVRPDVRGRVSGPTSAERAATLPRFADDVPRVAALTGWELDEWLR
ncbi:sulfotransferase family protein [Pseudonocardia lutea]|uniref:Sulfotransferase family protein n=1 Tax=Pseudonocardia lutea TaxID=2172015 RepID=A0ABW1IGC3_9PSEU